jgi:hypothetical protein
MSCKDIHIDFKWNIDEEHINRMQEDMYAKAMRDNWTSGGKHYGRTDPHDNDPFGVNDPPSGWYDTVLRDRPWPTSGNWIHAAIMTYVQEPPYELPPTIYMRLSFDGTWYPHKISNKKYTNTNHLKL